MIYLALSKKPEMCPYFNNETSLSFNWSTSVLIRSQQAWCFSCCFRKKVLLRWQNCCLPTFLSKWLTNMVVYIFGGFLCVLFFMELYLLKVIFKDKKFESIDRLRSTHIYTESTQIVSDWFGLTLIDSDWTRIDTNLLSVPKWQFFS